MSLQLVFEPGNFTRVVTYLLRNFRSLFRNPFKSLKFAKETASQASAALRVFGLERVPHNEWNSKLTTLMNRIRQDKLTQSELEEIASLDLSCPMEKVTGESLCQQVNDVYDLMLVIHMAAMEKLAEVLTQTDVDSNI